MHFRCEERRSKIQRIDWAQQPHRPGRTVGQAILRPGYLESLEALFTPP